MFGTAEHVCINSALELPWAKAHQLFSTFSSYKFLLNHFLWKRLAPVKSGSPSWRVNHSAIPAFIFILYSGFCYAALCRSG